MARSRRRRCSRSGTRSTARNGGLQERRLRNFAYSGVVFLESPFLQSHLLQSHFLQSTFCSRCFCSRCSCSRGRSHAPGRTKVPRRSNSAIGSPVAWQPAAASAIAATSAAYSRLRWHGVTLAQPCHREAGHRVAGLCYALRSAVSGSTRDARRAGIQLATTDATTTTKATTR